MNNDHALVIGIRGYPYLTSLDGPIEDARQFRKWLLGAAKVPEANVHFIQGDSKNGEKAHPVADEIDDGFALIFKAIAATPPRRLYVYFAGHGCSQQATHVLLLMANAREGQLGRGLNAQKYHERLQFLGQFPEQLFFYDCCRNYDRAALAGREPPWDSQEPGQFAGQVFQGILYGAGFTQYANERTMVFSTKRGLFTRALIEGLNGGAAGADGVVTLARLDPFVAARLEELAKAESLRQDVSPVTVGKDPGIVLAEGVDPWVTDITVLGAAGSSRVEAKDDKLVLVDTKPYAAGQATLQLRPGMHQLIDQPSGKSKLLDVMPLGPVRVVDFKEA